VQRQVHGRHTDGEALVQRAQHGRDELVARPAIAPIA
jgi:hypothetical protein